MRYYRVALLDALLTIAIGFALGVLIGLTGVGGGALVAPALYVVLGMTYTTAVAMSLVYSVFTKIVGFFQHLRLGNIDWKLTFVYSAAAIPGAVIGARALYEAQASERVFALGMAVLLAVVALLMLAEAGIAGIGARKKPFDVRRLETTAILTISILAFVVGIVLGMTSVGSGSLIILSMLFFFQLPARVIVGSNIAIALVMVVPAGLTHALVGGVDVRRLALLMTGSVLGAIIGSRGTAWVPDHHLKLLIAVIVLISAAATFLKAY